jgi:hypothetical protein
MKKPLVVAAMIGFFLPLFWGTLALILFNLRDPLWTRVFWFFGMRPVLGGGCPVEQI